MKKFVKLAPKLYKLFHGFFTKEKSSRFPHQHAEGLTLNLNSCCGFECFNSKRRQNDWMFDAEKLLVFRTLTRLMRHLLLTPGCYQLMNVFVKSSFLVSHFCIFILFFKRSRINAASSASFLRTLLNFRTLLRSFDSRVRTIWNETPLLVFLFCFYKR